jgi:uncharacterized phage protein (TIGR01671 family)
MREIKFRIWNKTLKKYIYSEEFEGNQTLSLHFFFKFIEDMKDCGNEFGILEQYSNLIDKNHDEIYEGDIVKITEFSPPDYKHESSIFITIMEMDAYHLNLIDRSFVETEIIGNIHENPELLENE